MVSLVGGGARLRLRWTDPSDVARGMLRRPSPHQPSPGGTVSRWVVHVPSLMLQRFSHLTLEGVRVGHRNTAKGTLTVDGRRAYSSLGDGRGGGPTLAQFPISRTRHLIWRKRSSRKQAEKTGAGLECPEKQTVEPKTAER